MTLSQRASLARRLLNLNDNTWQRFAICWAGFNTLYNLIRGGDERSKVKKVVTTYITQAVASRILNRLPHTISYFNNLPPGNMRIQSSNLKFRAQTTADLQVVVNNHAKPKEQLARLMSVVYTVRCNLFHGNKDPDEVRDKELVQHSLKVLEAVMLELIAQIENTGRSSYNTSVRARI